MTRTGDTGEEGAVELTVMRTDAAEVSAETRWVVSFRIPVELRRSPDEEPTIGFVAPRNAGRG